MNKNKAQRILGTSNRLELAMSFRATSLKECDAALAALDSAEEMPEGTRCENYELCRKQGRVRRVDIGTFHEPEEHLLCDDGMEVLEKSIREQRRKIAAKLARRRAANAAMNDAIDSLGMKRVRGALGGRYIE